jgi:hypothetical protein
MQFPQGPERLKDMAGERNDEAGHIRAEKAQKMGQIKRVMMAKRFQPSGLDEQPGEHSESKGSKSSVRSPRAQIDRMNAEQFCSQRAASHDRVSRLVMDLFGGF